MKKIINNIPNMITISRMISCFIGAILFTTGNIIPSICFYVYGAISDAFDGFLARKLNAVSELGKKLDPISDKLYALSLMIPAIILKNYFMIIPLVFEGIISGINVYSETKYKSTYTEKIGKLKTIMLFPTMILGLLATLEPYLYVAFVPSLFISLKLQAKAMEVYVKQLDELKSKSNQKLENVDKEEKKNYSNELNRTLENKKVKDRPKKLVRKKEQ